MDAGFSSLFPRVGDGGRWRKGQGVSKVEKLREERRKEEGRA